MRLARGRPVEAMLAGLATATVCWPLLTLFTPSTWVRPALMMIAVVVATGVVARLVTSRGWLVVLAQLVLTVLAAGQIFGQGHLWFGLPTWDMVLAFNNLLYDARLTVSNYAAPAPSVRGIILGVGLAAALTAIIVDALAVTRRSPALAGLPLLTAFLISASNSGSSLHPMFFVVAAGVWLVMVGRQGVASLRRWSTTSTTGVVHREDTDGSFSFASAGRVLGAAGIAAAVVLPMVIPHLPTRYLVDGLGRSVEATGFSDGQIGLTTTVDIDRSLKSPSNSPVLSYTTNAPTPTPLRVGVLVDYRDGTWRPDNAQVEFTRAPDISLPIDLGADIARDRYRLVVDDSRLEAPQLAAPYPLFSGNLDGVAWGVDPDTQVARVNRSAGSYTLDYLSLKPERNTLEQGLTDRLTDIQHSRELRIDNTSAEAVRRLVSRIVPAGATRIEAAMAIQEHFRNQGYTYSLELAGPVRDAQGNLVQLDPISHFLSTKRGYCVQFATGMVMAARAAGIPARMAVGFLPGTLDKGTYTVKAADAHAWPELFFEGVGWLRFEPTPSTRTGAAPPYTLEQSTATGEGTATTGPSASGATTSARVDGQNDPGASDNTDVGGSTGGNVLTTWWSAGRLTIVGWVLLALLLAALGAVAVPGAARLRHRRRVREADDEAARVEVEWQSLVERLGDLGIMPPRGATPRQAGVHYRREGYLAGPQSAALGRVVSTVETSRYARPGAPLPDISEDADEVLRTVRSGRRRSDRWRATWLPQDGLVQWRAWRAAAGGAVGRPVTAALEWVRSRRRSD